MTAAPSRVGPCNSLNKKPDGAGWRLPKLTQVRCPLLLDEPVHERQDGGC